ncbi:MAG: hypothetical protein DI598_07275 [Pseudopedobacter saltans]|uniref:Fibronectin type-III domain-containing protein n=1 Tax=Pseudopedobacter saltans TaxID=151895 RepID=A0A2W5F5X4_9SPHI|nr:MAG: hypothetical protein DI598_07275 [Pseudopedobacter saltans]
MKNITKYLFFSMLLSILFYCSCNKATDYKKYFDGHEIIYPGIVNNLIAAGGNNRALLYWNPSPDPTVTKYIIYWNNKSDSLVVNATTSNPRDTVKVLIGSLSELSIYNFIVYSFDSSGNKSIPVNVNNVRIYGTYYNSTLRNRLDSGFKHSTLTIYDTIFWRRPDTVNVNTLIRYTNTSNVVTSINLGPTQNLSRLINYKVGTYVYYKSSYKPLTNSPDTFYVSKFDSLLIAK